MRFAVDVRQGEVRRLQRTQRLALVGAQAEVPGGESGIMRHRLPHKLRKGRQIEPALACIVPQEFLLARFGNGETKLLLANSLRLQFKMSSASEIGGGDPKLAGFFIRAAELRGYIVIHDRCACLFCYGRKSSHDEKQE